MYRVAAYTNVGAVKESNQDSCCFEVAQTPYGDTALISVCDGVGGLASGEVASSSVVRWLCSWFEQRYSRLVEKFAQDIGSLFEAVRTDWTRGLANLNEALLLHGRATDQRLGSTCTAMLFYGGEYIIGHVGDCRVYQIADNQIAQLTEDQTWVAREVLRGTITPEQARSHPRRNVILQSVGTQEDVHPVFVTGEVTTSGDAFVVCCDGFRNELFDDEIAAAFAPEQLPDEQSMHKAMKELADLVIQRGERDNITAVCLRQVEGDDYGEPLIGFDNAVAAIVEQVEEATPTGYLEETGAGE